MALHHTRRTKSPMPPVPTGLGWVVYYDLRSSPTDRCPECGKTFDPALLRRRTWKRRLIALAVMAFVMYAPFGWLLLVTDDPTYVRSWLRMGPYLPGIAPTWWGVGLLSGRPMSHFATITTPWIVCVVTLALFTWIGSRSRRGLIIGTAVLLALSVFNAYLALLLFLG